jgi:poly-gamma-glutamate capsule biosynthesis protein CapA/YwtB (metallophosphatase superfamily)
MLGTNYPINTLPSDGGKNLFKYSKEYIKAADIRFANFEDTFFDGEKAVDGKAEGANRYLFRTPTIYGALLADAGFNVVSLANNHALDFGAAGIESTRATLKANGIQFTSKGGKEVAQFNIRGITVALIGCDFYSGRRSLSTPVSTYAEIKELKKHFNIVIVSVHAGGEGQGAERVADANEVFLGENRGNSVAFAHTAIDMGASLILMHGPHVPRGLEVYKNKLIAYSLGNFTTGRGINIEGYAGAAPLLRVQLDHNGNFSQGHLASFRQTRAGKSNSGAIYDESKYVLKFMNNLSELDFPQTMPQFDLTTGRIYPR